VNDDDLPWIEQCLAGQSAAFGHLVRKYQDRLFNTLVHLLGSPEEARDVVQEALTQAFVKLESFQRNAAFYTWLYRIAFNTAISHRRKKRPVVSVDQTREAGGPDPCDPHEGPAGRLEQEERVRQVQTGLAALTEEHRVVLVLKEIEGYSYEDIAEILDIPLGTVRSRLFRARLQLREVLKEVFQEDLRK